MALRDLIANAVGVAFTAIGDIPDLVVLKRVDGTTYNAVTGQNVENIQQQTVKAVLYDPQAGTPAPQSALELDQSRMGLSDKAALIEQRSLAFSPKVQDDLITSTGIKYVVVKISEDPVSATWTLWLKIKA